MNPERIERHNQEFDGLPLQAPIPIPWQYDGENAVLADLAELVFERLDLIGQFDPAFALDWAAEQLARHEEEAA